MRTVSSERFSRFTTGGATKTISTAVISGAAEAAALGVWLHGRAGELLEEEITCLLYTSRCV